MSEARDPVANATDAEFRELVDASVAELPEPYAKAVGAYLGEGRSPREIAEHGFDIEVVRRVAQMVDRNEYKRRQAAPGVRISKRAFGRDRRFPITSRYDEQQPSS